MKLNMGKLENLFLRYVTQALDCQLFLKEVALWELYNLKDLVLFELVARSQLLPKASLANYTLS